MSPDLERLIALQRLDTAIANAKRQIIAHPEQLHAIEARLTEARLTVDAARQTLKDSQETRRTLEKDAAVYQGRLSKFKDQLSAVKTNREYQAMQKEMEAAQTELRGVEDKVLDQMLDADGIAAQVKSAEAAFAALQKQLDLEKQELAQALTRTEESLTASARDRGALVAQLDPALVALFEQVAKARKGIGVCAAQDGLCTVCRIRLRPHVYQQVRANNTIIQCDSCQRILYYIPPPAPVEHPVTHHAS